MLIGKVGASKQSNVLIYCSDDKLLLQEKDNFTAEVETKEIV